ncbi:MAG: hypothetical protein ACR2PA_01100 [Hyphomicrobiaceae bacterium]
MNVVEFRYNRRNLVIYVVLAAVMIALGLSLVLFDTPWGADAVQGYIFIGFSLCGLLFVARVWSRKRPVVRVGPDGIHDTRLGNKSIIWTEVAELKGYGTWDNRFFRWFGHLAGITGSTNTFIGIVVADPNKFYGPSNPAIRILHRITSWLLGYPLLSINMGPLDGTYEDLREAILDFTEGKGIETNL